MCRYVKTWFTLLVVLFVGQVQAEIAQGIIDIPTRSGVSQRLLVLAPLEPKATVILFAGVTVVFRSLARIPSSGGRVIS